MSTDCQDCLPLASVSTIPNPCLKEEKEDDETTFLPPVANHLSSNFPFPCILIEYCYKCNFYNRSNWIQTELFQTFPPNPNSNPTPEDKEKGKGNVNAICLLPSSFPGRFRIWISSKNDNQWCLIWDRKLHKGFPELKVLKQLIRDRIAPNQSLGHSDKKKST